MYIKGGKLSVVLSALSSSPTTDGLAVPIVFDSIGDSFVFTILLIFELALSERNRVLDGEMCHIPYTAEEINMFKDIERHEKVSGGTYVEHTLSQDENLSPQLLNNICILNFTAYKRDEISINKIISLAFLSLSLPTTTPC